VSRDEWSSVNIPVDLAYKLRIYANVMQTTAPAIVERLIRDELTRADLEGIATTLKSLREKKGSNEST
jgi:hypothetical protein